MFLTILKKIFPYTQYILMGIAVCLLGALYFNKRTEATAANKALAEYKRQVAGQLTTKEQDLEKENDVLGVAQSKLLEQSDLLKSYQEENIKTSQAFEDYKKKYDLQLTEYNRTIAQLQEQIKGITQTQVENRGTGDTQPTTPQIIDTSKQKIAYSWTSGDGRFSLLDPDIFTLNNETFKLDQSFRITGEVYEEKVGFLKTERLTLEEVIPDGKNADGSIKYKTVGNAKIVENNFKYSQKSPASFFPKKGCFGLWPTISADLGLRNGIKPTFLIGTGITWVNYKGLGSGLNIYFDTLAIKSSAIGIDLSYRPSILGHQLNVAFNVGIATQFQQMFNSFDIIAGTTFFIW